MYSTTQRRGGPERCATGVVGVPTPGSSHLPPWPTVPVDQHRCRLTRTALVGRSGPAANSTPAIRQPLRDALADHNGEGVGIGARHLGHYRGIGYPDSINAFNLAVLVHHCQRVRIQTHLAGARNVASGANHLSYPKIQAVVVAQNLIRRSNTTFENVFVSLCLQ